MQFTPGRVNFRFAETNLSLIPYIPTKVDALRGLLGAMTELEAETESKKVTYLTVFVVIEPENKPGASARPP